LFEKDYINIVLGPVF